MKKAAIFLIGLLVFLTGCQAVDDVRNMFVQPVGEESSFSTDLSVPRAGEAESSVETFPAETEGRPSADTAFQDASGLIPDFSMKYFLNQLNSEELACFLTLYRAVAAFEDSCEYPYPISAETENRLTHLLVYECPEIMQYDREATYTYYSDDSGWVTSRTIPYRMSRSEYENKYQQAAAAVEQIRGQISSLSVWDQEIFIYRYIISHMTYDREAKDSENTYGTLINGRGKCDGIAMTFKWVMDLLGVPNYVLTGRYPDDSDGHAWNVVQIDGRWYDLDITHDDMDSPDFPEQYIYGLFNVSDTMIRSQYVIHRSYSAYDLPGTSSMTGSYHVRNGTYVYQGGSLNDLFDRLIQEQSQVGDGAFSFQVEDPDQYQDFINNTQKYIDEAAEYAGTSFYITWYSSDESRALWCYVTF